MYLGPISGSADVAFARMQFQMFFADLDWQVGRGCLASFSGPDDTTVHFYATSDSDQGGLRLLVRWETSPEDGVVTLKAEKVGVLGSRPLCGHAVASDGSTSVYFARKKAEGEFEFRSIEVPTNDVTAMNAFIHADFLPDAQVDEGELTDGPLFVDEQGFQVLTTGLNTESV